MYVNATIIAGAINTNDTRAERPRTLIASRYTSSTHISICHGRARSSTVLLLPPHRNTILSENHTATPNNMYHHIHSPVSGRAPHATEEFGENTDARSRPRQTVLLARKTTTLNASGEHLIDARIYLCVHYLCRNSINLSMRRGRRVFN